MIIALRTDSPEATIVLFDTTGKQLKAHNWEAGRTLARELLKVLHEQLKSVGADWHKVTGVVVFKGPGSFTGLRIGLTVANSLAYGLNIPIVATQGDGWLQDGLKNLSRGQNDRLALPYYGGEANITLPKK